MTEDNACDVAIAKYVQLRTLSHVDKSGLFYTCVCVCVPKNNNASFLETITGREREAFDERNIQSIHARL